MLLQYHCAMVLIKEKNTLLLFFLSLYQVHRAVKYRQTLQLKASTISYCHFKFKKLLGLQLCEGHSLWPIFMLSAGTFISITVLQQCNGPLWNKLVCLENSSEIAHLLNAFICNLQQSLHTHKNLPVCFWVVAKTTSMRNDSIIIRKSQTKIKQSVIWYPQFDMLRLFIQ